MGNRNRNQVTYQHFFFGQVTKRKNFGKQVITVVKPIIDKSQFERWKENYLDLAVFMNKQSLFLPDQSDYRKIQRNVFDTCCCGAEGETVLTYQDFQLTLHMHIANKKVKQLFFQQKVLIFILYKLLEGSKQFELKNKSLGDIRPKNIVYTNSKDLKMINLASYPWEKTPIDQILDDNNTRTIFFLAPQQIRFLNSRQQRGKYPNSRTQAFSIGLTVLEAATLQQSQSLYKMPSRSFDNQTHNERLAKVQKKYPLLYPYLFKISQTQPNERLSSGQAWSSLRCYSEKITQLQLFQRNIRAEEEALAKFRRNSEGKK